MIKEKDKRRLREKLEAAKVSCSILQDEAWMLTQDPDLSADEFAIFSHAYDGAGAASVSLGFIGRTLRLLED